MHYIKRFILVLFLGVTVQLSAQETSKDVQTLDENIEEFKLPTFSELSNDIATDYTNVLESLPNLSNIGAYVDKEIRRGFPFEHSTVYTVRNFSSEHSILPNVSPIRFQLRNILNTIMFTGFDANQLHLNESYKGPN
ncbi:hypothetical protein H2O64_03625 [Kordia sp. YSTF-M3]|uniref:Uncharacterized protein n=1 Tax=Kordia aestuariivivens TaxID=2759037 RepID=A0ABR7Q5B2_9FLAO|nr:hypothetical protein [Kordia aestuariivivens]MBC8753744.1 hypothetical protein [Kordia aestuariivivens]